MRKPNLCIASILLLLPMMGIGQQSEVEDALKKGDANALTPFMSTSVDLSIPGHEKTVTTSEAVKALSGFFQEQGVKGYKKMHTSTPQQGRANFTIGDLYTTKGTYRLTLFFNQQQKISEVSIRQ